MCLACAGPTRNVPGPQPGPLTLPGGARPVLMSQDTERHERRYRSEHSSRGTPGADGAGGRWHFSHGAPQLQGGGNWGDSGKGAGCPVEEVEETAQGTHLQARRQAGNQWMHLDGRAAPFGGSRRCGGDLSRKPGCTGGRCRLRHPETRNGDPGRRSRGSPSAQLPPGGPERAEDHGEDT